MPLDGLKTGGGVGEKVGRDAFLYEDPRKPDGTFAQCGTCRLFLPRRALCAVIGIRVAPQDSCGLYVHGEPTDDQRVGHDVTAKEAGFVRRQVRCENCKFFKDGHTCALYETLNHQMPHIFDLDTEVDKHGCCNAQTPIPGQEHARHAFGGRIHPIHMQEGGDPTEDQVAALPPAPAPTPAPTPTPTPTDDPYRRALTALQTAQGPDLEQLRGETIGHLTDVIRPDRPTPYDDILRQTVARITGDQQRAGMPTTAPTTPGAPPFDEHLHIISPQPTPPAATPSPTPTPTPTPTTPGEPGAIVPRGILLHRDPNTGELTPIPGQAGAPDQPQPGTPASDQPSTLTAGWHAALRSVIPGAAGMTGWGAGSEAGAAAGAALTAGNPIGIGLGYILGGLAGGYIAGRAAGEVQDTALNALPEGIKNALGQSEKQRAADYAAHPYATQLAEIGTQLMFMRPGEIQIPQDATVFERALRMMPHVTGAAVAAGQEAVSQAVGGQPLDLKGIGIAAAGGAFLSRPSRIGGALEQFGAGPVRKALGRYAVPLPPIQPAPPSPGTSTGAPGGPPPPGTPPAGSGAGAPPGPAPPGAGGAGAPGGTPPPGTPATTPRVAWALNRVGKSMGETPNDPRAENVAPYLRVREAIDQLYDAGDPEYHDPTKIQNITGLDHTEINAQLDKLRSQGGINPPIDIQARAQAQTQQSQQATGRRTVYPYTGEPARVNEYRTPAGDNLYSVPFEHIPDGRESQFSEVARVLRGGFDQNYRGYVFNTRRDAENFAQAVNTTVRSAPATGRALMVPPTGAQAPGDIARAGATIEGARLEGLDESTQEESNRLLRDAEEHTAEAAEDAGATTERVVPDDMDQPISDLLSDPILDELSGVSPRLEASRRRAATARSKVTAAAATARGEAAAVEGPVVKSDTIAGIPRWTVEIPIDEQATSTFQRRAAELGSVSDRALRRRREITFVNEAAARQLASEIQQVWNMRQQQRAQLVARDRTQRPTPPIQQGVELAPGVLSETNPETGQPVWSVRPPRISAGSPRFFEVLQNAAGLGGDYNRETFTFMFPTAEAANEFSQNVSRIVPPGEATRESNLEPEVSTEKHGTTGEDLYAVRMNRAKRGDEAYPAFSRLGRYARGRGRDGVWNPEVGGFTFHDPEVANDFARVFRAAVADNPALAPTPRERPPGTETAEATAPRPTRRRARQAPEPATPTPEPPTPIEQTVTPATSPVDLAPPRTPDQMRIVSQGTTGDEPAMTPVRSSNIESAGYNPDTRDLHVQFKGGRRYLYRDVPPDVVRDFLAADSPGRFFRHIRDAYQAERPEAVFTIPIAQNLDNPNWQGLTDAARALGGIPHPEGGGFSFSDATSADAFLRLARRAATDDPNLLNPGAVADPERAAQEGQPGLPPEPETEGGREHTPERIAQRAQARTILSSQLDPRAQRALARRLQARDNNTGRVRQAFENIWNRVAASPGRDVPETRRPVIMPGAPTGDLTNDFRSFWSSLPQGHDAYSAAAQWLLQYGKTHGAEATVWINRHTGEVHAASEGYNSTVGPPEVLRPTLRQGGDDWIAFHSHPSDRFGTAPSDTDTDLLNIPSIGMQGVIGVDGNIYMMSLTPKYQELLDSDPLFHGDRGKNTLMRARDTLFSWMRDSVARAEQNQLLTRGQGNQLIQDLIPRILDAAELIDYVSTHDLRSTADPQEVFGRSYEDLIGDWANKISKEVFKGDYDEDAVNLRTARSTAALRPHIAMGELSSRLEANAGSGGPLHPLADPAGRGPFGLAEREQAQISGRDIGIGGERLTSEQRPEEITSPLIGGAQPGETAALNAQQARDEQTYGPGSRFAGMVDARFPDATDNYIKNAFEQSGLDGYARQEPERNPDGSPAEEIIRRVDTWKDNLGVQPHSVAAGNPSYNLPPWLAMFITPRGLSELDLAGSNQKYMAETAKRWDISALFHKYISMDPTFRSLPLDRQQHIIKIFETMTLNGDRVPLDGSPITARNDRHLGTMMPIGTQDSITDPNEIRAAIELHNQLKEIHNDAISETIHRLIPNWGNATTSEALIQAMHQSTSPTDRAHLRQVAALVSRMERDRDQGLLPLMPPSGDYYIAFKHKTGVAHRDYDGQGKGPGAYFTLIESEGPLARFLPGKRPATPANIQDKINEIRQQYGFDEDHYDLSHGWYGDLMANRKDIAELNLPAMTKLMTVIRTPTRAQIEDRMVARGISRNDARVQSRQIYNQLVEDMQREVFEARVSPFRQPQGVPGYSNDFTKSIATQLRWGAAHAAGIRHRDALERANNMIANHRYQTIRNYWGEWDRRNEDLNDPYNGPLRTAREVTFAWLLGMNAATSAKIFSHGFMVAAPVLSTGLPRAAVAGEYLRAFSQVLGTMGISDRGIVARPLNARGLTPDEQALMQRAIDRDIIHSHLADDMRGQAWAGQDMLTPRRQLLGKVMDIWGSNVSSFDTLTRAATLLTAYRIFNRYGPERIDQIWGLREDPRRPGTFIGDANWDRMAEKTAETWAWRMVEQTSGIGGDFNRAQIARGKLAAMPFQFHTFEMNYFATLWKNLTRMGPEGKVTAALMLGGLAALGGATALPLAKSAIQASQMIWGLITGITPDIEGDMRDAANALLGDGWGDVVTHGLPRGLGVDLQGIGFGDIATRFSESPYEFFGAAASNAIGQPIRFGERLRSDQGWQAAARELMPNAFKHIIDSMYPEASLTAAASGRPFLDPEQLSSMDHLKMALGFIPAIKSRQFEADQRGWNMQRSYFGRLDRLENRMANAEARGDAEGFNDAMQDAMDTIYAGTQYGVFRSISQEAGRFRSELRRKIRLRTEPGLGTPAQQRMRAANP